MPRFNYGRDLDRGTVSFLILFLGSLILLLFTFRDSGITWDEQYQAVYGDHIIHWYSSFFQDQSATTFWSLPFYGGFFDLFAQLVARISPTGLYETRHFLSGLFGLAALAGTFLIARHLHSTFAGLLAALFLALTPRFTGHALMNPKDIPFAGLYALAFYYLLRLLRDAPFSKWSVAITFGALTGLVLGMRVGGVILLAFLGLGLLLKWTVDPERLAFVHSREKRLHVVGFLKKIGVACLVAYVTMLAFWPAAQISPIKQPLRTLLMQARFTVHNQVVLFEGSLRPANDLPWYYIPKWFALTLPEHYAIGLLLGLVLLAGIFLRSQGARDSQQWIEWAVLAVAVLFPPLVAIALHSILYDEVRHFLFLYPLLAVAAAVPVACALRHEKLRILGVLALLLVAGSFGFAAKDMVELHPYEYVYFNRLVAGGLASNFGVNETEYWGSSYKEGVKWLRENHPHHPGEARLKVASCSHSLSTSYYLPEDQFEYVGTLDRAIAMTGEPDIFLATTRWNCHRSYQGRVVHVVTRQETPLLYVVEVPAGTPRTRPY